MAGRVRALPPRTRAPCAGLGSRGAQAPGRPRGRAPRARAVGGGGESGALRPGPGIGARGPPLSGCPSGSPRDRLAQPTEVRGPSGSGWPGREGVWGWGLRSGAEGRIRRGAGSGEGRGRGCAAPGGRGGRGLGSRRGLLGQRSYWGRDRKRAWLYRRGFWRGGGACGGRRLGEGLVLAAAGHLEPGAWPSRRASGQSGSSSGAPFWRVCGTDPSRAQPCLGSGEGSPTLRKGLRRCGAAELCGHEGQSHPCA